MQRRGPFVELTRNDPNIVVATEACYRTCVSLPIAWDHWDPRRSSRTSEDWI